MGGDETENLFYGNRMSDTATHDKDSILIVDDDITLLEMASELLGETYQVSSAKSGTQALELLEQGFVPDIILLDIAMPLMDGYTTFEKIRALPPAQDIPVVFLTGLSETGSELKGLEIGAADYIVKPFVREILLARIKIHLEKGREIRRLRGARVKKKKPRISTPLTPWEQKIAVLAQERLSAGEIAEKMSIKENTIKSALKAVYGKLGIHSKRDLAELDLSE